jgi:uncharacterized RDD family membrane protein YckC
VSAEAPGFVRGGRRYEYGGFGRRLLAAALDSLVWIVGIAFFFPGYLFDDDGGAAAAIAVLLVFSAWFNYFAVCERLWGQTIGKNALGLRVMPLDGGRLAWNAAAMRNLLRLVDLPLTLVGVLYFVVQGSPRRQRLGDRVADTIVVRDPRPAASPPPAPPPPSGPTSAELFGDAVEAVDPSRGGRPRAGGAGDGDEGAP